MKRFRFLVGAIESSFGAMCGTFAREYHYTSQRTRKAIIFAFLIVGWYDMGFAQEHTPSWKMPTQEWEKEIGTVVETDIFTAFWMYNYNHGIGVYLLKDQRTYTEEELYEILEKAAKEKYSLSYPRHYLRNFKCNRRKGTIYSDGYNEYYDISAVVVIPDVHTQSILHLCKALEKALRNVQEGARVAIDQVTVNSGINREEFKDQLVDILLDKGYRVVAKEYLARLFEEQQNQQSGIYNERTTVQENNFSAIGYFIYVKATETSVRVQVVNVSTGEYEGNTTINFNE